MFIRFRSIIRNKCSAIPVAFSSASAMASAPWLRRFMKFDSFLEIIMGTLMSFNTLLSFQAFDVKNIKSLITYTFTSNFILLLSFQYLKTSKFGNSNMQLHQGMSPFQMRKY